MTDESFEKKNSELRKQLDELSKENKQLQTENKRNSQQLQYLNGIPSPIMAIDESFSVTYMNETGAKLVGETAESVVGKKCFSLFKTTDCKTDKCACGVAMRTERTATSTAVAHPGNMEIPIQYVGRLLTK